jgi:ABC-type glycerol-3-phosphate transport system permease component
MATATHAAPSSAARPALSPVRVLIYAVLIVGALAAVLPFVYMVMTSLKTIGSIIANNFWPWPPFGSEPLQWANYPQAIRTTGWDAQWGVFLAVRYFANSLIVTAAVTLGVLFTSITAAYALAQMNLPGKNLLFLALLATIMIPNDLTLVPKVVMMFQLGWYNTYLALTVPFMASVFGIFLLRQFFLQIPRDLFEAAVIDGAGHLRYLLSVVVPLSRPAIVTIALFQFIWEWDSFKWPLLVTRDSNMRVLAVGLQQFMIGEGGSQTQLLMAGATLVIAPVVVFYFFTQRYFREGIVTTGIKG